MALRGVPPPALHCPLARHPPLTTLQGTLLPALTWRERQPRQNQRQARKICRTATPGRGRRGQVWGAGWPGGPRRHRDIRATAGRGAGGQPAATGRAPGRSTSRRGEDLDSGHRRKGPQTARWGQDSEEQATARGLNRAEPGKQWVPVGSGGGASGPGGDVGVRAGGPGWPGGIFIFPDPVRGLARGGQLPSAAADPTLTQPRSHRFSRWGPLAPTSRGARRRTARDSPMPRAPKLFK